MMKLQRRKSNNGRTSESVAVIYGAICVVVRTANDGPHDARMPSINQ